MEQKAALFWEHQIINVLLWGRKRWVGGIGAAFIPRGSLHMAAGARDPELPLEILDMASPMQDPPEFLQLLNPWLCVCCFSAAFPVRELDFYHLFSLKPSRNSSCSFLGSVLFCAYQSGSKSYSHTDQCRSVSSQHPSCWNRSGLEALWLAAVCTVCW